MAELQQFSALQSIGVFQAGQADKEKRDRRNLLQEVGGQLAAGDFAGGQATALEAGAIGLAAKVKGLAPDRKAELSAFYDDIAAGLSAVDNEAEFQQLKELTARKYPGLASDPTVSAGFSNLQFKDKDIIQAQVLGVKDALAADRGERGLDISQQTETRLANQPENLSSSDIVSMTDAQGNLHTLDLSKPADRQFAIDNNLRPAPTRAQTQEVENFTGSGAPTSIIGQNIKTVDQAEVTLGMISDFREVLKTENVGIVGSVRRIAQGATEQAKALAPILDAQRNEILNDIVDSGSDVGTALFTIDETLAQAELLENVLAYRFAKTMDPGGRVAKDDLKAAQSALGSNKFLAGEISIGAKLDAFEKMVKRQQAVANRRLDLEQQELEPTQATTSQPAPSPEAIDFLRANPDQAAAFDSKYGQGAARSVLGG